MIKSWYITQELCQLISDQSFDRFMDQILSYLWEFIYTLKY